MNTSIAHFKGTIYPDKTFSIGYCPKPKIKTEEKRYNKDWEDEHDSYEYEYMDYGRWYRGTEKFFTKSKVPDRFINCSQSSQIPKPPKKYGLNGITKKGKKVTSNCALLLQQKYGKSRIGFVTCTLPGYSSEVLAVIAEQWSEIVRKFYQQVRRDLKKQKAPLEYVGVTEVQEKRWKKDKAIALHLHFAYVARPANKKGFYIDSHRFREIWEKVINKTLEKKDLLHGCNQRSFNASIDCVIVKKSVAGYLGKYISKGCKVVDNIIEQGLQQSLPGQWWTASMQLKDRLKRKIIVINPDYAKYFMYAIEELVKGKMVERYMEVFVDFGEREYRIGLCGKISEIGYHIFTKKLCRDYEAWLSI